MTGITPIQKRLIAFSIFVIITSTLIGSTIYQTYFSNPVTSLPQYQQIDSFTLPVAFGGEYTYNPSDQQVTVVSWMYTKCPGDTGCALLTTNMADLESRIKTRGWETNIQFISIDFDYINDTMEDLEHYAEEHTNDYDFWKFLLGNENQTNELAKDFAFYFEVNNQTNNLGLSHGVIEGEDPYIHSMLTYIIDRDGYVRKLINGVEWDFIDVMDSIEFLQSDEWQNTQ